MLAKLRLALGAAVLSGFFVVAADNGALAAVPVDPLGITPQETQRAKDLIDSATWNLGALVAWPEKLRETRPDPGVIGEISLDLALLVGDDNPNRDTILALIQDMLATAGGNIPGFVPTDGLNLAENACQDAASPTCNN